MNLQSVPRSKVFWGAKCVSAKEHVALLHNVACILTATKHTNQPEKPQFDVQKEERKKHFSFHE